MKDLLKNFAIFLALSLVFSTLTGCPTASTQKGPGDETKTNSVSTETKRSDDSGYPAPPAAIAQADIKMVDGSTFKLEEKKGKVILFNLWGIWCGPCIQEMPHLVQIQEKYKDKNFEIIGLNVGDEDGNEETAENINAFVQKQNLNYQIGYADRKLFEQFAKVSKLAGVPQSVLINREGKMIGVFSGGGASVINSMKETVDKAMAE
jgi:thiol-disulfide isomerase/thioredoxin